MLGAAACRGGRSPLFVVTAALDAEAARIANQSITRFLIVCNTYANTCKPTYTLRVVCQEHDGFCDMLHLDGASLPVATVTNPETGAQRVIPAGRIRVSHSRLDLI